MYVQGFIYGMGACPQTPLDPACNIFPTPQQNSCMNLKPGVILYSCDLTSFELSNFTRSLCCKAKLGLDTGLK